VYLYRCLYICFSIEEEEASPVNHALGTLHGGHAGEEKLSVYSVVRFCYIQEDGSGGAICLEEGGMEEGGEVDVVFNETVWDVCVMIGANGRREGVSKSF